MAGAAMLRQKCIEFLAPGGTKRRRRPGEWRRRAPLRDPLAACIFRVSRHSLIGLSGFLFLLRLPLH